MESAITYMPRWYADYIAERHILYSKFSTVNACWYPDCIGRIYSSLDKAWTSLAVWPVLLTNHTEQGQWDYTLLADPCANSVVGWQMDRNTPQTRSTWHEHCGPKATAGGFERWPLSPQCKAHGVVQRPGALTQRSRIILTWLIAHFNFFFLFSTKLTFDWYRDVKVSINYGKQCIQ